MPGRCAAPDCDGLGITNHLNRLPGDTLPFPNLELQSFIQIRLKRRGPDGTAIGALDPALGIHLGQIPTHRFGGNIEIRSQFAYPHRRVAFKRVDDPVLPYRFL